MCEQTVKQVLPQLLTNKEQLEELIKTGNDQITKKGEEILKYKDEHNIKIAGQTTTEAGGASGSDEKSSEASNRNVLVVNN